MTRRSLFLDAARESPSVSLAAFLGSYFPPSYNFLLVVELLSWAILGIFLILPFILLLLLHLHRPPVLHPIRSPECWGRSKKSVQEHEDDEDEEKD